MPLRGADIAFPDIDANWPISVAADTGRQTQRGAYRVYEFEGQVRIDQAGLTATSQRATLWVERISARADEAERRAVGEVDQDEATPRWKRSQYKTILRLHGDVHIAWSGRDALADTQWMGRLYSESEPTFQPVRWIAWSGEPPRLDWAVEPRRLDASKIDAASRSDDRAVQPAQFAGPPATLESIPAPQQLVPQSLPEPLAAPNAITAPLGQSELPLGGLILEGEQAVTVTPPRETTVLQPLSPGARQIVPPEAQDVPAVVIPRDPGARLGVKTFEFTGRGSVEPQSQTIADPATGGTITAISRGLRMKFGGTTVMTSTGPMDLGTVLVEADRALVWTSNFQQMLTQSLDNQPIEIYLEGNVVFQQGERTIYADRMYYNVQAETGMVLGAEILTPAPQFEGLVRLKADVVEQRSRQEYLAYNAALTSSRLGVPRYWLQADRLNLRDTRAPNDAAARAQELRAGVTNMEATSRNNFVYVGGVPLLYWPVLTSNIDSPNFYLRSIRVKNDEIFGQQVFVDSDLYQLLGLDGPDGTDWLLSTDYLSKRGFALGTTFRYNVPSLILPGASNGFLDVWGLNDRGLDRLGEDRNDLLPERRTRGRLILRHRQYLSRDLELWAEVGLISDRNFQEQYFEREWDQEKDFTTALRLRRYWQSQMFDIWGQARLNRFHTETEWLPRIDHYLLGQSIFDRATWYAHNHVGYGHVRPASTPLNPVEIAKFQRQPREVDAEGLRAATRQELAVPLELGPTKVVPYASGEAATWGEDVTGNSLSRFTGQAGVRSSLPFWRAFPQVQSRLFNVNGLAHKVSLNSEFFYADTNRNVTQLPLYDPLDDNAQEHFRRRLIFNTFGGALPPQFDSTNFAIRQGLQRYVTANAMEVVEDQMQFRVGVDQRWQTKRGRLGRERIADLVEFDVDAILYPKADRDNFGSTAGAINYDFRYHVGDRVSLLSDGYFDVFDNGLKIISGGAMLTRPGRGEWYVGLTSLQGPIDSLVANSNLTYRMNEKWMISGGSTFDLGEVGNVGQNITFTRIGESFLAQIGLLIDSGRDNTSVFFNLEPRFFPFRRIGSVGGQAIPVAGRDGLE